MMMMLVVLGIAVAAVIVIVAGAVALAVLFRSDANILLRLAARYGKSPAILKDQVCWITGASRGVGESVAYELAKHGLKLVLSGRNADRLEEVKKKCLLSGPLKEGDVLVLPFDIKDTSVHAECVQKVLDQFGQIDIFVNNVARYPRTSFAEGDLEAEKEHFDTAVFGPVSLVRAVLKHMLSRRSGKIAITSSVLGKMGYPSYSIPAASSHALHGFFECLRMETAYKGIQVCMACPGPIYLQKDAPEKADEDEKGIVVGSRFVPPDRFATLLAVALANNLSEVWIATQPLLFMVYVAQFSPTIWKWFMSRKLVQTFVGANKIR